jgi:magnesium chelatase family protein
VLAIARTFALVGVEAEPVHVELDVNRGLPSFTIVGLPDAAVRESRERVRSALVNSGFEFPLKRITANLAPADLRKAGPGFDLAIAAGLLVAGNQLTPSPLERYALAGELALDGSIRRVPGALAMAEGARRWGMRGIAVAPQDAGQAALVDGLEVVPIEHVSRLRELGEGTLAPVSAPPCPEPGPGDLPDLADLRGQPGVRAALEIAAAGAHSMLLIGPPGGGKTLAARRLPSLLPPLGGDELLEVTRIASACGENGGPQARRPFRAPHHTVSGRALVGGGTPPRPGEVTRAHRGVLFLDELGEFRREALEALRVPLEDGSVTLSRGGRTVSLPCRFMLVAASNPCPCGHGPDSGECDCHPGAVARYRAKLSGALSDRIDLQVRVDRPDGEALAGESPEGSESVLERVVAARARQEKRLGPGRANSEMTPAELRRDCRLDAESERTLKDSHRRLGMSGRGWDRALAVARTIADLEGEAKIRKQDMEHAISLRRDAES